MYVFGVAAQLCASFPVTFNQDRDTPCSAPLEKLKPFLTGATNNESHISTTLRQLNYFGRMKLGAINGRTTPVINWILTDLVQPCSHRHFHDLNQARDTPRSAPLENLKPFLTGATNNESHISPKNTYNGQASIQACEQPIPIYKNPCLHPQ